jgi:hypothetical protein
LDTQEGGFTATSKLTASVKELTGAHIRSNVVDDLPEDGDAFRKAVRRVSLSLLV